MKQIYFLIIFLTIAYSSIYAQSCVTPIFSDASAPPGSTSIDLGCGGGTASMSATFNGQGTIATNTYGVSSIPFSFTTFTGTTVPISTDDVWSANISIPFSFCFFGRSYNSLLIGSNGIVSFDVSTAGALCPYAITPTIPSATYPRASIMGVYNDIDPRFGSSTRRIQYTTIGVAPCRQFIVSFEGIAYYGSTCAGTYANYQIVLNESTNIVEVQIQNHNGCSSTSAGRGIVGIQNFDRTVAYAAPGRNAVTFSTTNEAWRFTPTDTTNPFRRMIVHLFENGTLVDSAVPYYSPFPTLRADFMRSISFPPDSHLFHVELIVYDSTGTGSGTSLCTVSSTLYDFNDLLYYSSGSLSMSATTTNVNCFGETNGAIDITATSTSPPISYIWNDGSISEDRSGLVAGTYTVTVSDGGGCTSVNTYTITEPPMLMVMLDNITDVTCYGGSNGAIQISTMGGTMPYRYMWSNGSMTEDILGLTDGVYCTMVTDTNGCMATLCDTVMEGTIDSSRATVNICAGDFVIINGIAIGTAGSYADTFSNINSCDSIHTIDLVVGSRVFATINPRICLGDTFSVLGRSYTSSGIYYDTTASITGCDSVLTINLIVNNPSSNVINSQLCTGESINVGTNTYSTTGTYYDTLVNINGCDSFITTNLLIKIPSASVIDTTICFGQSVIIGTTSHTSAGTTYDTLTNSVGCDSTVRLNLTVRGRSSVVDSFVICKGQSIVGYSPLDDTTVSTTLTNIYGCDSIYTIFIGVQDLPKVELGDDRNIYVGDTVLLTVVPGYSYNWSNGVTINRTFVSPSTTTTYSVTITDSIGCVDSGDVIVNVSPRSIDIAFPSAFTPNGDGLNDMYYPLLPVGSTITNMIIFNRWGNSVYSGILAPGWDGNFLGAPQPIGNYVYYITVEVPDPLDPLRTITETYNGTITLLR
jgi:gliding motility-associated-like protein